MFSAKQTPKPPTLEEARVLVLDKDDLPESLLVGAAEIKFVSRENANRLLTVGYELIFVPYLQKWTDPNHKIYALRKDNAPLFLLVSD